MTLECRDCGCGLVGGVYVSSGGVHRCRGCHEKMLNHWAERFRRKLGRDYVEEEAGVMRRLEPEVVEVVEADAVFPATSLAVTSNLCAPGAVSTLAPVGTVPSQVARPDPPSSSHV